jgi:uncharacterized membrane protein
MMRQFFQKIAVLAVAAAALALPGKTAHADLKFTNYYQKPVYVAIGWNDDQSCNPNNPWRAKGWYRIERGETKTLWYGDLAAKRYWYFYAMSEDRTYLWQGDYYFWVNSDQAFDICDDPGPGIEPRWGFRELDMNGIHDYTYPLY